MRALVATVSQALSAVCSQADNRSNPVPMPCKGGSRGDRARGSHRKAREPAGSPRRTPPARTPWRRAAACWL